MSPLAATLAAKLEATAKQFHDLVDEHADVPWRDFLLAWGELRQADILERDGNGSYFIGEAKDRSDKGEP